MPADKLFMGGLLTAYNVKITDDASIAVERLRFYNASTPWKVSVWRDGATPIPYAYL